MSKQDCAKLIAAIERTKNGNVIRAANKGDLKPAEAAANARAETAQQDLAVIAAAAARIDANTTRIAAGVEHIDKAIPTLKKETSEDPIKEFANRGKRRDDFEPSLVRCDLDDVRLYKSAKISIPPRRRAVLSFLHQRPALP